MRKQKAEYMKHHSDYVTVREVEIGNDSSTGQAVMVFFKALEDDDKGGRHWIPYSQLKSLHRSVNKRDDSIEIADWLAKKLGLDV